MTEFVFSIETLDPVAFCGVNDVHIHLLQEHFPTLKILPRGNAIRILGEEQAARQLVDRLDEMLSHFSRFGKISREDVEHILGLDQKLQPEPGAGKDQLPVLLYGNQGLAIKPRNENQLAMSRAIEQFDLVFALGPAGTGKSYLAVALAVKALKEKAVRRIVLTRPAVEAGENLGFLPGDFREKLDPYLQPLYDALRDMLPAERLNGYLETGIIQIAPLAFMRGRTLDHSFVILDEAQNTTESQMKMFLTRMGPSAKFVITGDQSQIDLPRNQKSGLIQAIRLLEGKEGMSFIRFHSGDVIRHRLVKTIIRAYQDIEQPDKGRDHAQ